MSSTPPTSSHSSAASSAVERSRQPQISRAMSRAPESRRRGEVPVQARQPLSTTFSCRRIRRSLRSSRSACSASSLRSSSDWTFTSASWLASSSGSAASARPWRISTSQPTTAATTTILTATRTAASCSRQITAHPFVDSEQGLDLGLRLALHRRLARLARQLVGRERELELPLVARGIEIPAPQVGGEVLLPGRLGVKVAETDEMARIELRLAMPLDQTLARGDGTLELTARGEQLDARLIPALRLLQRERRLGRAAQLARNLPPLLRPRGHQLEVARPELRILLRHRSLSGEE